MKDEPLVTDWRHFCQGAEGMSTDGDAVNVIIYGERQHRIRVRETADTYELTGRVARLAALSAIPDAPLRAWRRNRGMQLVGFRIDDKGRLVGEAWVPKAGLKREEFLTYVRRVAAECNLFEYQLTGKDRE
jgi:hypothetical protein